MVAKFTSPVHPVPNVRLVSVRPSAPANKQTQIRLDFAPASAFAHRTACQGKMRIIELIIDGFKSYPGRTSLTGWDPSFNAITGL